MTDGGRSRVCELKSIDIFFGFFTVTLSNVVRLLQNFVHSVKNNLNKCCQFGDYDFYFRVCIYGG